MSYVFTFGILLIMLSPIFLLLGFFWGFDPLVSLLGAVYLALMGIAVLKITEILE